MKKEKIEYFAYFVISALGIAFFGFIFFRYALLAILPFLLGWLAAFASDAPASALSKSTRISARVWRLVISAVATLGVIALLLLFGKIILGELWNLLSKLGEGDKISKIVNSLSEQMLGIFGRLELPKELEDTVTKAFSGIVTTLLTSLGTALSSVAGAIPRILLFIVITVIAAIYFALDLEKINHGVRRILPPSAFKLLVRIKNGALTLGVKYLRSYFLIMLMTFSIMFTGLLLLRVEYAFLFAIIIAVLDLLPIIGVGTALVPASVFCFLSGNRGLGIGLIILFLVNEAVRQFAEPRILGRHLGIHPLATLASIYIGYSFFGFAGIFLLPLLIILLGIYKNDTPEVAKDTAVN